MTDQVDYHNLEEYLCRKCGEYVIEDDGYFCCECYRVPMFELAIGAAELPDFWVIDNAPLPSGIDMIIEERRRQIEIHGFTPEHDEQHTDEQLAMAAAFYAIPEKFGELLVFWPFEDDHNKSKHSRIEQLATAGAWLAAEIDRLNSLGV